MAVLDESTFFYHHFTTLLEFINQDGIELDSVRKGQTEGMSIWVDSTGTNWFFCLEGLEITCDYGNIFYKIPQNYFLTIGEQEQILFSGNGVGIILILEVGIAEGLEVDGEFILNIFK